jgi:hypothetical protein
MPENDSPPHKREGERFAAAKHPLGKASRNYVEMVDQWFKDGETALHGKEEEILSQAQLGVSGVKEDVARLTDVVQTLRRHQHKICDELMRSLEAGNPEDSDTPVKAADMAIDSSIASWLLMKEFFPDKTDGILTLLVHLDRLRRAAEKEFPDARKFVRPGFDTGE